MKLAFKNRNDSELCWENCYAIKHSAIQKHLPKKYFYPVTLASFLFTDGKDIHSDRTEKPTEWLTECICSGQEERRLEKMSAHTGLTFSHWRHQSARVTSGWQYISLILVDHEVKINEVYYRSVMLLQQFLLAACIHQISSKFFVFQQDSARRRQRLGSELSFL